MLPARDSWRVNTAHVSSFVLISILRGQPRTPPSGDNLGAIDYHLKLEIFTYVIGLRLFCADMPADLVGLWLNKVFLTSQLFTHYLFFPNCSVANSLGKHLYITYI